MITFEDFEQGLHETLNHLYDPVYTPPDGVCTVMGIEQRSCLQPVQTAVIGAMEAMRPAPNVPPSARSRRIFDVLDCRYLQRLTQDETAERLAITPRHLRREQGQAVNALARQIWEYYQGRPAPMPAAEPAAAPGAAPADEDAEETRPWLSQVRQELDALEKGIRGSVANLDETIAGVVELVSALAARRGVGLTIGQAQPGLAVAMNASKLRQVLVLSLTALIRQMAAGEITIRAEEHEGVARITMAACPAPAGRPPEDDLVHELLADHAGGIEHHVAGDELVYAVTLAAAPKVKVLVLDDNPDLMHFYRRYVQGTRYQIVPLSEGTRLLETVQAVAPAIIVLDVMLPDIDGWELLVHLHNHPATRSIPVILCSVMREEELALSLGAALYVPKPVRRQEFIQALDGALSQVSA
jgi:CheY-like chemotaxis protein